MKLLCTTVFTLAITTTSFADIWTVDDDGKADFNNIQAAVDAASNGDEILIMPGVYQATDTEAVVDMRGKSLKLTGNSDAQNVIIDGSLLTPGILCTGGEIENITIQNCYRTSGGGIFIESGSPIISDCIIENNFADYGGGVMAQYSNPQFYNCTFNNNTATQRGGGIRGSSISAQFDNCVFSNNTAQRGGGVYLYQSIKGMQTTFTNCSIQNNTVSSLGGGVVINSTGTTALFDTCSFTGNESTGLSGGQGSGGGMYSDSSSPTLLDCTFDSNTAESNGGGLYNWYSSPFVNQCQFTNNVAGSGGAILSINGAGPSVSNSSFCENIPSNIAGVHIDDGTNCLANSCADLDNNGISDECEGSVFTVDDDGPANFDNIQAAIDAASDGYEIIVLPGTYTSDFNQVIYIGSPKDIWLHSSDGPEATIIDGQGKMRCAAIFGMPYGALIEGFTFTNGFGNDGGGMVLGNSNQLTINNCIFTYNIALNQGGGIYCNLLNPSVSPTLENCTFESNFAKFGGAIHMLNSNPVIDSCIFADNDADSDGGAIALDGSNPILMQCNFTNNEAIEKGGAMYIVVSNPSIDDCIFEGNIARYNGGTTTDGGGGIYSSFSNPTLYDCTFTGNYADNGGGIQSRGGEPFLNSCTFTGNIATGVGGGLANYNNSDPTLSYCTFRNNSAENGGGFAIYDGKIDMTNCEFENNVAYSYGGGIFTLSFDFGEKNNCTFTSNSATLGGGIFTDGGANISLDNCVLESNTASESGGAIFSNISSTYLDECTISGNMSGEKGGAIYNNLASTIFKARYCTFTGNSSMSLDITTNFGGALYNEGYAEFEDCEISDNSSGYGGAFHTTENGSTDILNCEVKRNIAKVCGGASFNLLGNISSQETLYCGNLPDHLVGGWVNDGGNELLDICIPDEPAFCICDMNQDYDVDVLDLLYLIAVWDTANPAGDINDDGWVDVADLLLLIGSWGRCP